MMSQITQEARNIAAQLQEVSRKIYLQYSIIDNVIGDSATGVDKSIENKLAEAIRNINAAATVLQQIRV